MEESEIIVKGPDFTGNEYWGSIGEFLIPKMKSQPNDFVVQVDYATGETITSREFLKQSLEIAEGLLEFGIKLGDVVVFACPNNIKVHAAAMGTIFCGAVFAAIDQTLRAFELQHLFKDFKPKLILCEAEKGKEMQSSVKSLNLDCKILLIDSTDTTGGFYTWNDIKTQVDVDNYTPRSIPDPKKCVALISCSSGSTGMPKGVALSHYALMHSIATIESGDIKPPKSFLFVSPLFWISGTSMLLHSCFFGQTRMVSKSTETEDILQAIDKCKKNTKLIILLGKSVGRQFIDGFCDLDVFFTPWGILLEPGTAQDSSKVFCMHKPVGGLATCYRTLQRSCDTDRHPDFLLVPPSLMLSLVEHEDFTKYNVSSVKILFSAGATLNSTIASIITEKWKGVVMCNCYGLTETCILITLSFDSKNPDAIGKLSAGVSVKVVDVNTGKSLGPNNVGECRVKTERVMNGYYNDEEATKAAFDENGWLRTGDLVYYNEEGVFFFVSRMKEIIPYLNYKITPVEIESFIIGLPGVKDVAVVGVPHETDTNHLRALVVKHPKSDITAEYIIEQVKENFTDRKHLREGVQFVEALPRTRVGKLRRAEAQKMVKITK